jgi:hexosaminidase
MRKISTLACLLIAVASYAQTINIIPAPVSIKQPKIAADFVINPATQIVLEGSGLEKVATYLNNYLQRYYSFKLKLVKNTASSNAIRLNYERFDNPIEGAYQMTVNNKGVYIAGDNANGVFYGVETLLQLFPIPVKELKIPTKKLNIPYVVLKHCYSYFLFLLKN